jgi:uncharacterized protein YdhG (YjbR/CyaY superfamily)
MVNSPENIDSFISTFPSETQKLMQKVRSAIAIAAPDAKEKISYGIPSFDFHGNLVHFSAYKNHIGFYPGSDGIKAFEKELEPYKFAKGSIQFPIHEPLPIALITKITQYRVKQNLEKLAAKKSSNKKL